MGTSPASATSVKVYFENLNAIRFIAAFLVIIHHVEQFKNILHVPNHWENPVIEVIGKLGVVLFFVLSGFLISYLLFKEKEVTGTIGIRDFYIRRMLRIWPLYFLIVLSAFFLFPFVPFFTLADYPQSTVWHALFYKLALYVLFLPNVVLHVFGVIPYASQAWSIGAEEQFYLVWPGLNKLFRNKWLLMLGVIVGYLLIKFGVYHVFPAGKYLTTFNAIWESTPIDCMAIGGFYAIVLYENSSLALGLRRLVFNQGLQWATLLATVTLVLRGTHIPYFHYEVYAVLFGLLICNFAANPRRIFSMENPWSNYLGKISYGLYMFHSIAIVFSIRLLQRVGLQNDLILYPLVFALVVVMSSLSYNYFEKRFISMKGRYAKIISGDSAKEELKPEAAQPMMAR